MMSVEFWVWFFSVYGIEIQGEESVVLVSGRMGMVVESVCSVWVCLKNSRECPRERGRRDELLGKGEVEIVVCCCVFGCG
ncbi:hypothetical protein COLO4_05935 [Corchorus olitorius]|uniref:Uncharacterized protein n=1 Tax=Corchorus olitorius TaxID=93759 RepID=A0A1R3KPF9_9ROSI|nr:hypothetical protein COLO4_05935 [Corchorus olitorius]